MDDLNQELTKAMSPRNVFDISLFGYKIPISDTVITMWIVMVFLIVCAFIFTRKMKQIPKGKQNFVEVVVEFINKFSKDNIGHHWKHFAPYLGTILLFLVFANTISIFNIIPGFSIRPPTRDINVTACMAIMSMLLVLFSGIRFKKLSGWLKSFLEPLPLMLPFKILDYFIRPISLCFRLFGNVIGAFIVMELIYVAMPLVFPAALSIYFDLFDGILQAYIFVFLTSLYIAETIE